MALELLLLSYLMLLFYLMAMACAANISICLLLGSLNVNIHDYSACKEAPAHSLMMMLEREPARSGGWIQDCS